MREFEYYQKKVMQDPHRRNMPPSTYFNVKNAVRLQMVAYIEEVADVINAMDEYERESYCSRAKKKLPNRTEEEIKKDNVPKYDLPMVVENLYQQLTKPYKGGFKNPTESMLVRWNLAFEELDLGIRMVEEGNLSAPSSPSMLDKFFE